MTEEELRKRLTDKAMERFSKLFLETVVDEYVLKGKDPSKDDLKFVADQCGKIVMNELESVFKGARKAVRS